MIVQFDKEYRFLSNFYLSPFSANKQMWPTVEHFFQAMKTKDLNERMQFTDEAITPGQAKRMGRKLTLRSDWEDIKFQVMRFGLEKKFTQNVGLGQLLINTYPHELVEGNNWHDNIWGSCSCEKCKDKIHGNALGKLLMEQREQLMKEKDISI